MPWARDWGRCGHTRAWPLRQPPGRVATPCGFGGIGEFVSRADGGLPAATWSRREKRGSGRAGERRGPAGTVGPLETAVSTSCIQTNSTWVFFLF